MGPPRIADQLLQLKTVARKEHSRLLCSLAVSSQLRIGHARQQPSYSYDATGQSATGFQCDEVVQSTTGISLVESGNAAAKSQ